MSAVIDADPNLAGLPPPLLLSVPEASQLIYVLRQDRPSTSVVQLIAARNGEGVSTLARDISLVAAGILGLDTLLLATEPAGRGGADWPRSVYGMPAGLRQLTDAPAALEMHRVSASPLVVAAPAGSALQPAAWSMLIKELRPRFGMVLVDAPSAQRAFTGTALASVVDSNLMVVAAESTRASAVRALRDRLAEVGGHIAGVILNKRRFHVPRAAYERL